MRGELKTDGKNDSPDICMGKIIADRTEILSAKRKVKRSGSDKEDEKIFEESFKIHF